MPDPTSQNPTSQSADDASAAYLENHPFSEMQVGDGASLVRQVTRQDIRLFSAVSGDVNPVHLDEAYAQSSRFQGVIAQGMLGGALISAVLGTRFPGPGTIYVGQRLKFLQPVRAGDTLAVSVRVTSMEPPRRRVLLETRCVNQDGVLVIDGEAEVIAPKERQRVRRIDLPTPWMPDPEPGPQANRAPH